MSGETLPLELLLVLGIHGEERWNFYKKNKKIESSSTALDSVVNTLSRPVL